MKPKRILSFFLAMAMLVIMLPTAAFAATTPTPEDKFNFDESTGAITGLTDKTLTEIIIPETIGGTAVTSIGETAFHGCIGLTSITIPSSVRTIGGGAFSNCSGLTSITIPSSVRTIGGGAFEFCSGLTSITIPNGVSSIELYTFHNCIGLTSITIPSSVSSIGNYAFSGCIGLTSITIPSSVNSIEPFAFSGCSGLTSITIPSSVNSIGNYAFSNCSGLTSITIPSSVNSIGYNAFNGCRGLTSITIPSSVNSIGKYAFLECSGLTSVTIQNGVTSIDEGTFYGCRGLTSITIPSSVNSIGYHAFEGCSGLTSITIPSSVSSIGERAFDCCIGIEKAYFLGTESDFGGLTIGLINTNLTEKAEYIPISYTAPQSLVYDGNEKSATVTTNDASLGDITIEYYQGTDTVTPKNAGTYRVVITIDGLVSDLEIDNFTIRKATAPSITNPTAPNTVTYGETLSATGLTAGWTWVDGNTIPTVINSGYTAYYTPDDPDNYDWTAVDGWNASENRVERIVAVTVNKATPQVTAPTAKTGLVYDGKEKELIEPGQTTSGTTMQYRLANGTYSTEIPKGTTAGNYTVYYKVVGNDNYNDVAENHVEVTVAKADSQTTTTADATVTYGETLTLTATVTKSARALNKVEFYVGEGDDAKSLGMVGVTYTDEVNGTATLEIDTKNKQLEIGDNKITAEYGGSVNLNGSESGTITVTLEQKTVGLTWNDYKNLEYDSNPKNVTATATGIESGDGEIGVTVTGGNETNAGNHTATATELTGTYANYYKLPDNATQDYTIKPKAVMATISDIADQTYTGRAIEPQITVYDDDTTVIPASEYTVTYSSNENAGTATVTLTDNAGGNYTVSGSKDFTIAKKSIENATLSLDGELTYNGQPQTQNVTLTLNGFTNVTFDISDNEQTDVKTNGKYTLIVTGTVNFEGTKTLDWNIKPYTPTEKPDNKTTARVRRGRTLAEATVTEGEILGINDTVLEGTFAWVDDTKAMSADGTEQMTFTPTDTNYAPVTIDVVVSTYSSGGGGTSRYTVKFDTDGGNAITNQTVTKNSKATEPTEPTKEGYIFDGWYTDSKFTTEYDFDTKVTKNITLYAKWGEDEVQEPSDDKKDDEQKPTTDEWKNPFTDVIKADWFFDNIRYANENGLMSGVTSTEFAPNLTLTRGMLVTILYRLAGEPAVNKSIPFADVTADSYYANAVVWAEQNGIVSGISETEFAPDENITREQIAVIIYRYAKSMEYDVSVGENTNILSYTDFEDISEYAVEAVQYAVGMGLMKGKTESTLNPKDNATRAEIAAILQRFIEGNK